MTNQTSHTAKGLRIRSGHKCNGFSNVGAKIEASRMKKEGYENIAIKPLLDYYGNVIPGKFVCHGYIDPDCICKEGKESDGKVMWVCPVHEVKKHG